MITMGESIRQIWVKFPCLLPLSDSFNLSQGCSVMFKTDTVDPFFYRGVHFILAIHVQFDFVLQWLKLTQFLVMCHFYWTLATRALRREVWATRYCTSFCRFCKKKKKKNSENKLPCTAMRT